MLINLLLPFWAKWKLLLSALHLLPALMSKSRNVIKSELMGGTNTFHFLLSTAVAERIRECDILLFRTSRN